MRTALLAVLFLLAAAPAAVAQPMSGPFTVGGTAPDFATLADASAALVTRGVSGPVALRLRPGTYQENGGASPVLVLPGTIAGLSPVNRLTIEPDVAAGGTVDNVILKADFSQFVVPHTLVIVRTDHTTFRNLTFADGDSMDTPAFALISVATDAANPTLEGLEVDGCVFLGTPHFPVYGTDQGIASVREVVSATITGNRFVRICRGINSTEGLTTLTTMVVAGNQFLQGFRAPGARGLAMDLTCLFAHVTRNTIDFAGGSGAIGGIQLRLTRAALVERNLVTGRVNDGNVEPFTGISVQSAPAQVDSIVIANNVVVVTPASNTAHGISLHTPNARVLYNTVLHGGGPGPGHVGVRTIGADAVLLNNIVITDQIFAVLDLGIAGQSAGIVSDFNVLFSNDPFTTLVRHNDVSYPSLAAYQAGTGLDAHSASKSVLFAEGFRLDECQAQDPDLIGTPVAGVTTDHDGVPRDPVLPFRGAFEGVRVASVWSDGFRAGLDGMPFSLAAGDFYDGDGDADIVVPDYDNQQVRLFRNLAPARSFTLTGAMLTSPNPTVAKLVDFDGDGHLDLFVGCDGPVVDVFWGEASGGFAPRVTVATAGRVQSLEHLPQNGLLPAALVTTEDDGFVSNAGYLGFIINLGGRQLCHDVLHRQGPPPSFGYVPDTIQTAMTDLAIGDLDGTGALEVIALGAPLSQRDVIVFHDMGRLFINNRPCNEAVFEAPREEFDFHTASYLGHNSSIVIGDFDGDGDRDLLTTTASEDACRLIRNGGGLSFSADTIPAPRSRGLVTLDFEGDGDLDFITTNRTLADRGITLFVNDGAGQFEALPNCFFPFASGFPHGIVSSDFDGDGRPDIAIASSFDSLFVIYNNGLPVTGVEPDPVLSGVADFSLAQNHPNPFGRATTIAFRLPRASHVRVTVYDIAGRQVATLLEGTRTAGVHTAVWDGRSGAGTAARGVYFCRLAATPAEGGRAFASVRKMILLR